MKLERPERGFEAQYAGWCAAGGDEIEPGELITAEDGEYVHVDCLDAVAHRDRRPDVCERCFLTRPCEHDE